MIEGLYPFAAEWSKRGAVYCISDLHFNEDDDLRRAYPNRPSADELVKIINRTCGRASTILLLGDCGDPEMVKKIRGYKVLIAGNHEACASSWDGIVDEYYAGILTIGPHLVLSHEPIEFPYGYLLHGHDHNPPQFHYGRCNVCADVISYTPLNLNQFVKSGKLKECDDVHRATIDGATARKQKRLQRGRAKTYIPPELLKEVAAACSH